MDQDRPGGSYRRPGHAAPAAVVRRAATVPGTIRTGPEGLGRLCLADAPQRTKVDQDVEERVVVGDGRLVAQTGSPITSPWNCGTVERKRTARYPLLTGAPQLTNRTLT